MVSLTRSFVCLLFLWRLSPDTGHYSGSFGERNPREVRVGGGGGGGGGIFPRPRARKQVCVHRWGWCVEPSRWREQQVRRLRGGTPGVLGNPGVESLA